MTNEKRRRRQRTYPLHSLEECIQIPKEIVNVYPNYLDVDLSKQELKNEEKYLIYAG